MPPHQAQGEARRAEIMAFVRAYFAEHSMSPSMIEISHAVGLSSPNATRSHLLQLEKQGKIRLRSGIARSIVLVD
jgi:SOS-response transcriptional repressor LexA